jgi:flagellar basal body-associated protein FliL
MELLVYMVREKILWIQLFIAFVLGFASGCGLMLWSLLHPRLKEDK